MKRVNLKKVFMSAMRLTIWVVALFLSSCDGMDNGTEKNVLIPVQEDGTYVYINNQGEVMKPEVDVIETSVFYEGYALVGVKKDKKALWGFINKKGKLVIPAEFEEASVFSEGLAWVRRDKKSPIIAINPNGKEIIRLNENITQVRRFSEGLAAVEFKYPHWGYIDKKGMLVISAEFTQAKDFSNGLAAVVHNRDSRLYGFINKKGEMVIPETMLDASFFNSEGFSRVGPNYKSGIINKQGEFTVPFSDGYQIVPDENGFVAYELWGKPVFGYIKGTGEVIIPFEFYYINPFNGGKYTTAAPIPDSEKYGDIDWEEEKYGIIDRKGNMVVTPQFYGVSSFKGGMAVVNNYDRSDGMFIINEKGQVIFKFEYPNEVANDFFSNSNNSDFFELQKIKL